METIILILLLSVLGMTASAHPVKTSPQYYKVLLENDRVRRRQRKADSPSYRGESRERGIASGQHAKCGM